MKKISFVIPCYRSTATLPGVVAEIQEAMKNMEAYTYEIVLVNDCSPDDTFETIRRLCGENEKITGISLAKNFGQHSALMAGFHHVTGDLVVCLDDDGQTPALEAGKLIRGIEQGADVVYARYQHKHHSGFRNFGSHVNELMTRIMLGKPRNLYVSSYFAARRFVVEEMIRYEYAYPYVIGLVLRSTKNIVNVDVNHRDRRAGESGYTLGKLLNLWFNGFTAFSVKPLRVATLTGVVCALCGFAYGIYTIIKKIFIQPPDLVIGFSALMSVIVFMGGMLMLMLGLVGEYMGRMYISMNNSPQFVIREIVGKEAGEHEEEK
ncbi:MAG: glycosyltransferase family 2 protein [Lachnospiraceae bacterium]|nr:glycosyltransferase family 2 protein [Lachnospiraceae bacterium]